MIIEKLWLRNYRNYEKEEEYFKNAEDTEGLTNILLKTDYYDIS